MGRSSRSAATVHALCVATCPAAPRRRARPGSRRSAASTPFGGALAGGTDDRPTGEGGHEPAAGLHEPAAFYAHNPIPTSCSLLRRSALEEAGGFGAPDVVAEDWDLWLRLRGS